MPKIALIGGSVLIVVLLVGVGAYSYVTLSNNMKTTEVALEEARIKASETEAALTAEIAQKTEENIQIAGELRLEQQKNGTFTNQIKALSGTVGTLEKLAKTDPELLAKYSKIYFLNENYSPASLKDIDNGFAFQEGRTYQIHADVDRFLENLLDEAKEDGLSLMIASSYRSFSNQAALKSSYTVRYGTGANTFSADQGYSEHQLGTAVDFTTPSVGGTFAGFDKTDEYEWLDENAWRYGFILSYPKGNTYYQYEPWHWRFVGRALAERLHDDKDTFYDLDQRVIDGYLGELFD